MYYDTSEKETSGNKYIYEIGQISSGKIGSENKEWS